MVVPSVACRTANLLCNSELMKATVLEVEIEGSCNTSTWTWVCTADTVVHCVDHLWCDPLAHCNVMVEMCTCQGLESLACNATLSYLSNTDVPGH
jgi:hypothetical protein